MNVKTRIASVGVAGALLLGGAAASPAQAARPLVTGGLVNVTIVDVLNDTQLQVAVPINVAAAICGVTVNVLATALAPTGTQTFNCPASTGNQTITASR